MNKKATIITLSFLLLFAVSIAAVYLTMPKGDAQAYVGPTAGAASRAAGSLTVRVVDKNGKSLSGKYEITKEWSESADSIFGKKSTEEMTIGEKNIGVSYLDDNIGGQFFSFEGENVARITIKEVEKPDGDYEPLPNDIVLTYLYENENSDGPTIFEQSSNVSVNYILNVSITGGNNAELESSTETINYVNTPFYVLTITYTNDPKLGNLVVKNKLSGNDTDENKEFDFTVTLKDGEDHALANKTFGTDTTDSQGKLHFSLKGGGSKTITNLPDGTKYEIFESDYTGDGYDPVSWDKTPSGAIAGEKPDPSVVTYTATNTKNKQDTPSDPTPVSITLPLEKVVSGDEPESPGEFTFVLKSVFNTAEYNVSEMPMPEDAESGMLRKTFTGPGTHDLGDIALSKEGTYTYELSEENSSEEGYTYDDTKYVITYIVKEEGGKLVADRTITDGDGNVVETCKFTNEYEKPINDEETPDDDGSTDDKDTTKDTKVKKKSAKTDDAVNILPYIYAFLAAGLALSCTGRRRKTQ